MASPTMTQNAYGNLANGVSIAANGSSTGVLVDATTKFEVQMQVDVLTGGAAQSTANATVKVYREFGAGPTLDNIAFTTLQIPLGTASTHYIASIALPTGKYSVVVANGDTANAISYSLTSSTVDAIS